MTTVLLAAALLGAMWRELIIAPVQAVAAWCGHRGTGMTRQPAAHRQRPERPVRPAGWADEPWPPSRGWRVVPGAVEDLTR